MALSYVVGEVPSGTIDGENTIFTLANLPNMILSVHMDGAIYSSFSKNGSTLTLVDAPFVSLTVTYLVGETVTFTNDVPGNTFSEIIERVYHILAQRSTSSTYPMDTVKDKINSTVLSVCRGIYTDVRDSRKTYQGGSLRFLRGKHLVTRVKDKTANDAASAGDGQIAIDVTDLPTYGDMIVNGNVIHYSTKGTDEISGVTNLLVPVASGDKVKLLYKLPDDADKGFQLTYYDKHTQKESELEYKDFKDDYYKRHYWTIIGDETTNAQYIDIHGSSDHYDSGIYWFSYHKKPTEMTEDADTTILPDYTGVDVIAPIVAGELLWNTEKSDRANLNLSDAYSKLGDFYDYYANQIKRFQKKVRVKPYFNNVC